MEGNYTFVDMQLFNLHVTNNQVHIFSKNLGAIWKLQSLELWQETRSIHRSLKYQAPAYKFIRPGDIASQITAIVLVSTVCVLYEYDVPESCQCFHSGSLLTLWILSATFLTSATAQFILTEIFGIFLCASMWVLLLTALAVSWQ